MVPLILGILFSLLVSSTFAFVERDDPAERKRYFLKMFLSFTLSMLVLGIIMRFLPR